jgi:hypothetical protein
MTSGLTYRIDPGRTAQVSAFEEGFENADLALSEARIMENIQKDHYKANARWLRSGKSCKRSFIRAGQLELGFTTWVAAGRCAAGTQCLVLA